jgi:8-oxo-dGTP pyrophosphatase MutT (NUDIX family)
MRFDLAVARLSVLPDPLPPPLDALMPVVTGDIAARTRREPPPGVATRSAAVLVLLYPDAAGDARTVLIERAAADGRVHSGEVGFPGGKAEDHDADVTATALREATEEVGLDPVAAGVRTIGQLERFWIPVSDFDVTPVLALAERRPVMRPAPVEVARILEPTIARFLPGARVEIIERTIGGWPLRYAHYPVDGLSVWGATARVLSQLGAILAADGSPDR